MTEKEITPVNEIRYVGFWIRTLAFIIDNIVGFIITLPLLAFITIDTERMLTDPIYLEDIRMKVYLALIVIFLILVACWKYMGGTPGKRLLKSYIVNAADCRQASGLQLFVRAIGYIPSFLVFGLGFLWIAFDKRKQGWHDKIARTVVIYRSPNPDHVS